MEECEKLAELTNTVLGCARLIWCLARDEDMDDATREALKLVSAMLEQAASI